MSVGPKASTKTDAASVVSPSGAMSKSQTNKSNLSANYGTPSIQAQLEMNDIPEFANEPGPGHYFGEGSVGFSSMGNQKFSKCQSAPEINFPKTGWNEWGKVVISKGHTNSPAFLCKTSNSVQSRYELPSTLSEKSTRIMEDYKRLELRPDPSKSLGFDPDGSPGPAYNLRDTPGQSLGEGGAVGRGGFEPRPSEGRMNKGMGLGPRFQTAKGISIGPGEHARKDFAVRLDRGRSIGVSRSCWEKVITPGWEVEGRCQASKGVGPPLRTDIKKEGSRAHSIGRAERFPRSYEESCGPGPGAYDREERSVSRIGKQPLSDTRTPSQTAFGDKPKKPRFRMLLAQNTAKNGGWGYF